VKFAKEVCQSCAAPILRDLDKGTERSGAPSKLYCRRCYLSGGFTDPKMTVEGMRESVRSRMIEMKFPRFLAVLLADRVYTLKRWETIPA
jgi:hypothetical protein